ncbi:MAG: hypothetical protein ACTXOO_03925 [Sodalis sp. (in: enterobacteria)]
MNKNRLSITPKANAEFVAAMKIVLEVYGRPYGPGLSGRLYGACPSSIHGASMCSTAVQAWETCLGAL